MLPDIPIWIFFLYARLIRRLPQHEIWREAYYAPGWQGVFDAAHSFPLILMGMATAAWFDMSWWFWLFTSMGLHGLCDLPLHRDDAHRHFFPFSGWRFVSPISYWDARYHGGMISRLEVLAVLLACIVLWQQDLLLAIHWSIGGIAVMYALFPVMAWMIRLRRVNS